MPVDFEISQDFRWNLLQLKVAERRIKKAFQILGENKIDAILFKGWSAAKFYTGNRQRRFVDIDIAVAPQEFAGARKCLETFEAQALGIDLHSSFRHHDTVSWENLFENSQIIEIDEVPVRVLRPEDHLRVICVHWLTDGGEYLEKLWDVFYLVENRPEGFDWDRCLNVVSRRRRRWIVCTIGLAHKYLGLDLSGTPLEEEAKDLPVWLVKRVEKEWKSDRRLIPLSLAKRNHKTFLQQLLKRLPPNPITATIDCEGDFDAQTRILYQIRDIFKRLGKKDLSYEMNPKY